MNTNNTEPSLTKTFIAYLSDPSGANECTFRSLFHAREAAFKAPSLFEPLVLNALSVLLSALSIKPRAEDIAALLRLTEYLPSLCADQQIAFIETWSSFIASPSGVRFLDIVYKRQDAPKSSLRRLITKSSYINHPLASVTKQLGNLLLECIIFLLVKEIHLPNSKSPVLNLVQVHFINMLKWLPSLWDLPLSRSLVSNPFFDVMSAFLLQKLSHEDSLWLLQALFADHATFTVRWHPEGLLKHAKKHLGKCTRRILKQKML